MLKALIKKQLLELNAFYFRNKKTGKARTAAGIAGMLLLFAFVFISIGFAFFGMAELFANTMFPQGLESLYFALMSIIAAVISVIINAAFAYAQIYNAKDNDLLLAMPIAPAAILFTRIAGIWLMGMLYEALAFLPAMLVYWIHVPLTVTGVVFPILVFFLIGLFSLTVSCIVGFLIAQIARRVKSKAFVSVLSGLLIVLIYYFCYFRINALLDTIVAHTDEAARIISRYLYPFYQLGLAASGDLPGLAVSALIVLGLFAAVYAILSRSFIRLVTGTVGEKKATYHETVQKQSTPNAALFQKEWRHFLSSPAYMLNTGLGVLIMPIGGIFALVRMNALQASLTQVTAAAPIVKAFLPVAIAALVALILSIGCFTAPAISLEGDRLWILRSLPIDAAKIFRSKEKLELVLNAPSALFLAVALSIAVGATVWQTVAVLLFLAAFLWFHAAFGLMCNLKKPNLVWPNETVPIKQSASVTIALFGGWLIVLAVAGLFFLVQPLIGAEWYLLIAALLFGGLALWLEHWLKEKGAKLWEAL